MKQLVAGVFLLALVGVAGFLYRNTVEQPRLLGTGTACPDDVRFCPDGSTVARSGLSCAFAVCAHPNSILDGGRIGLVIPDGYVANGISRGESSDMLALFAKPQEGSVLAHTIAVYRYDVGEGATQAMLAQTRFQPADEQATELDGRFNRMTVAEREFYEVTLERFEGLVHTAYYTVQGAYIYRFDVVEHGVENWMSNISPREFPEHRALLRMLETLQIESV